MNRFEAIERALERLLSSCSSGARAWFETMEPFESPGPRRLYPARTLRTLHMVGLSHFEASVLLLRQPLLSRTADEHVRALIELFAHAAWIGNVGGLNAPMTPRQRALCLELGMAGALADELDVLSNQLHIHFKPGYVKDAARLRQHFARLHGSANCGCGGYGRRHRTVRPTLGALTQVQGNARLASATLLYGMWQAFSRGVHHPRLELLAAEAPGGAAIEPASVAERAVTRGTCSSSRATSRSSLRGVPSQSRTASRPQPSSSCSRPLALPNRWTADADRKLHLRDYRQQSHETLDKLRLSHSLTS